MPELTNGSSGAGETPLTLELAVEQAKRAYALRKFEEAVDHYATALEIMTEKQGDNSLETADLYFLYGKALLENAIAQSAVLGKEEPGTTKDADGPEASGSGAKADPRFSFGGHEPDEDDGVVDLLNAPEGAEEEEQEEQEQEENEEPEDDFNAAWEVLELARAVYSKQEDDGSKLKLADTYIALGDVSLETEKFDQAIKDYTAALDFKTKLLPESSRQIAEAHYKLSLVLDLTSGRLAHAIEHAEKARSSVQARLTALKTTLLQEKPSLPVEGAEKGKGLEVAASNLLGSKLVTDSVDSLSKEEIEAEIKEMEELNTDLELKIEDLKSTPNDTVRESAPDMVARELDAALNAQPIGSSASTPAPVNNLTSMVKKKKPAPPANESNPAKRKAENEDDGSGPEKKVKMALD